MKWNEKDRFGINLVNMTQSNETSVDLGTREDREVLV